MPSRTTRKSNRPRASDRTMVNTPIQPQRLPVSETRSASSLLKKMHLLRWNNMSTQVRGAQHQTRVFYGEGGWKPRKCFPAPVEGEIFSLTFPFIEQAITLRAPVVSANARFHQIQHSLRTCARNGARTARKLSIRLASVKAMRQQ